MNPEHRTPTHPGEILRNEFLVPLALRPAELAHHIGVEPGALDAILDGHAAVSAGLAWRLAQALETSTHLWLALQRQHDLARTRPSTMIPSLRSPE